MKEILVTLGSMYVTLMSPIVAGIINSIFCKTKCLKGLQKPMDFGRDFFDGKRIFGDNKTWKGFFGYLLWNVVCAVLWGFVCQVTSLGEYNFFYRGTENTILNNIIIGFLLGMAYALFELPNSFLKRRLGIVPGKSISGFWKAFFVFFDQADSVFGCVLVVCLYLPLSISTYFVYVAIGAATHILINMLLYALKLRRNMF